MEAWKTDWANLREVLTLIKVEIKNSIDRLTPMRTAGGTYVAAHIHSLSSLGLLTALRHCLDLVNGLYDWSTIKRTPTLILVVTDGNHPGLLDGSPLAGARWRPLSDRWGEKVCCWLRYRYTECWSRLSVGPPSTCISFPCDLRIYGVYPGDEAAVDTREC